MLSAGSTPKIQGLTVEQAEAVVRLSCLPAFKDLIAKVQADEVIVLRVPSEKCRLEAHSLDCVPVSDPKGLLSQWSKSLGCVPSTYRPGSCSVLTLPYCLCSSLAFGWTVVHQSKPCHTSGARKHLHVSQIQAPAILSLNLNINLGVMLPKRSHQ